MGEKERERELIIGRNAQREAVESRIFLASPLLAFKAVPETHVDLGRDNSEIAEERLAGR